MATPTFGVRINTLHEPGTVSIEVYEVTGEGQERATGTANTLAATKVPDRGDIPGDGDQWFDTGVPAQMVEFALLPDWIRNEALNVLAQGYIALMDRGDHGETTHTKNS